MSYFVWLFAVSFESKISTCLVVTRQFLSHVHMFNVTLNVTYKVETFSVRNILLRWLFTCVCFTPCAIAVPASKSCIVHRCLSRVSIFNSYSNYPQVGVKQRHADPLNNSWTACHCNYLTLFLIFYERWRLYPSYQIAWRPCYGSRSHFRSAPYVCFGLDSILF